MASGAGLNRVGNNGGVLLLSTNAASADSGAKMISAMAFSKWVFQLLGTFTGYSVQLYGTIDPAAYTAYLAQQGNDGPGAPVITIPSTSWFALPAPATESTGDTTQFINPLTAAGQVLMVSMPLVAVRAVATGTTQTGVVQVVGFAIP